MYLSYKQKLLSTIPPSAKIGDDDSDIQPEPKSTENSPAKLSKQKDMRQSMIIRTPLRNR